MMNTHFIKGTIFARPKGARLKRRAGRSQAKGLEIGTSGPMAEKQGSTLHFLSGTFFAAAFLIRTLRSQRGDVLQTLNDSKNRCAMVVLISAILALTLTYSGTALAQESETPDVRPAASTEAQLAADVEAADVHSPIAAESTAPAEVPTPKRQFKMNLTSQFKYSNMFRVAKPDPKLTNPLAAADGTYSFNSYIGDGDRNFSHRGLASDRGDMLTELDVTYGDFGVRASTAGWLDSMYNRRLHPNPLTTAYAPGDTGTHFSSSDAFQDIQFRNVELLDAFVFGKMRVGSGQTFVSFRAGQFAQVWGQTLFYGNNGIAGAMVPVDLVKALSVPNSTTKEIMRPVPQASVQVEFGKVSVAAYYQFQFVENRLPATGSYFDFLSYMLPGGLAMNLGPFVLYRDKDQGGRNGGQFGGQIQIQNVDGFDLGFYAIRFNDKSPLPNNCIGVCVNTNPLLNQFPGAFGTYWNNYHDNVNAFAVSATRTFGITNYALEVGARTHADLAGDNVAHSVNLATDGHAIGDSFHANLSSVTAFNPHMFCKETSLTLETAFNNLLSIHSNASNLDPAVKRQALALQGTYDMTYRQVLRGVDLMPKVGFSYNPLGKSAVVTMGPDRGGTLALGLSASYRDAWRASLTYNSFYGPTAPLIITPPKGLRFSEGQYFHDRDFISFSIYRTFGATYTPKSK